MDFPRLITAAVLGSLALALAGPAATAATTETGSLPVEAGASATSVRLAECSRGRQPADRRAVYRGAMRQVAGTRQMWMRFRLEERVGDGVFRTVKAQGLGVWRKSRTGVRRFAYRQRVLALASGASYRTVVSFRWIGGDGTAIHRARRFSPPCTQPGRLPDLSVVQITGGGQITGVPGVAGYEVNIVNRGPVVAGPFGVRLAVDGGTVDTQTVAALGPGKSRRLSFTGPACAATVSAEADPDDTVREAHERDNLLTSACPSPL